MPRRIYAVVVLLCCSQVARATVLTNTRPEIAQMASYWEVDSIQISTLANSLYPQFTNTWGYMQPSGSKATDGDEHFIMAQDPSGTGATATSNGESPIVAEIVNVTTTVGLVSSGNQLAKTRGIFRYYHEHAGELKYEI